MKKLTQFLNKKYLIFCSIGSETVLSCNEIGEVDISKSKNVCMWIFPTDKNIQALERYSKNTVNDLIVIGYTNKLINQVMKISYDEYTKIIDLWS